MAFKAEITELAGVKAAFDERTMAMLRERQKSSTMNYI